MSSGAATRTPRASTARTATAGSRPTTTGAGRSRPSRGSSRACSVAADVHQSADLGPRPDFDPGSWHTRSESTRAAIHVPGSGLRWKEASDSDARESVTDGRGVLSDRVPGFRAAIGRPRDVPSKTRVAAGQTARVLPVLVPVVVAGAIGLVAATVSLATTPPRPSVLAGALGLVGAAALAEAFPLPIEGVMAGATSLATVFIVAAAVVYDWKIAAVVGFVSMAAVELGRRKPLLNTSYNASLYVCSAIAAALAAAQVGERNLGALVLAGFVASVAFYVVDIVLLVAIVTRVRQLAFIPSLPGYFVSTALPFLIMASLTVTLVVLWDRS